MKRSMPRAKQLSLAAVFAALTAVGALISIPFYPVPLSLQTLFLYLCVLILKERAPLSQGIYLAMGAAGLPVFARGMAGYSVLIGPTGGFLLGFLLASLVSGLMLSNSGGRRFAEVAAIGICMAIVFLLGWVWLAGWMGWNFSAALWAGVIPFLPGDFLKAGVALTVAKKIRL
ncbi:MAG: biotin transporter BioY [Candidatus Methanosuratincola sp.]|jgi:biotin transport system substrate-specific component|uniref:Biotin transporter BioY n=2 Tax=Candidatus Methanosuratincola (ex Vanwonterghem et al. 2016) TaxID=1915412 RepID=A0A7J3UZA0_9CREN|nr:biotin transporter BioY [Candidatus Methanosuratincola sp.]RWX73182.1 MAG: Substrate-specific component BioY of biotin ECF transporter [Candidatus Methanosuratincola subterraneus]